MPFGTGLGVLVAVGVAVLVGRGVAVGQSTGVGVLVGRGVAVGRGVGDGPGVAVDVGVRVGRGVRVAVGVAVGGCTAAQDAAALAVVPSSQRMLKLTEITPLMLQPGATSTTSWLPSGNVTVALAETTCAQFSTQSSEMLDVSPSELQLVPNSGSPAALAAAWTLTLGVSVGAIAVVGLAGSLAAVAVAGWAGAGVAATDGSTVAVAGGFSGSTVAVAGGFSGSTVAGAG